LLKVSRWCTAAETWRRNPCWLALATICLAGLVACSRDKPEGLSDGGGFMTTDRPSILLITLDTTRADHLEPYGAKDSVTPALAGLADEGIVFEQAVAVAPVTAPAHASLLTGLYPRRHGLRDNLTHHLGDDIPTLAEWLATAGYRTAAFVSAVVLDHRYGLDQGFEVYDADLRPVFARREKRMTTERPAAETADRALAWLDTLDADVPFFLWVHFYDPHFPYSPPSPWAEEFPERPYDGEIAYMDSQVARLLQHPRAVGNDIVVAAIGDHGEGLGEHGEKEHGLLVYESTLRVPWILKLPSGPAGVRVSAPISQVDLVPTIAELVNIDSESTDFEALEGRSLLPLLRGDDWTAERLLFAEAELPFFTYGWSRLQTIRQGSLKYIAAPAEELYDLEHDPGESHNLAGDRSADVQRLAKEIEVRAAQGNVPVSRMRVDAETAKQLRALGYAAGDPGRPEGEGQGNPVELIAVHEELQAIPELMDRGQFAEAVRRVRDTLARDPDNLAALKVLSRGLAKLGRLDEAAEVAAKASTVAPWSAQALQVEADIEHSRGHYERALELIDRCLEMDARFLDARLDRSRYLVALGRRDEAIEEIEPLIKEFPDNAWVALRYAQLVELPAGNFRAAAGRLREVLSRDPYFVEAWLLLGRVLTSEGRMSDAVAVYREAIEYRADHADLQSRLALLLAQAGDPAAETALQEAIRSSPAVRADLHVALGQLLVKGGRREEARQQYEIAAAAPSFSADTDRSKMWALLWLGKSAEAVTLWSDLIRDRPEYGRAWLPLSSLSIQRGDWTAAERLARAAVEAEPRSASAWSNLGVGLEGLGRTAEAEAAYRRAGEVDASDWWGLFKLGILLRKSGRFGEAAAVQQEVLTRAPSNPGAHFELGILYAGPLADVERAKTHLQVTIDADPNHPNARQARAILDRLP
jgi:arylsulfatase A-like enzyme/Flp pilus assembly protein TadD